MHDTTCIKYPTMAIVVGVGALVFSGFWVFSARAEEVSERTRDVRPTPVREVVEANRDDRRVIREEQYEVRENMRIETQETRAQMREEGSLPEEMRAYGMETREVARAVRIEQREARVMERLEARENLHDAISDRREALERMVTERREAQSARMEERQARLAEAAQNRLRIHTERIGGAMERVLENLIGVAGRVEVRITQFMERGADVSSAVRIFNGSTDQQGVHELVRSAQEDVSALRILMEEAISAEDPKAHMASVREAASLAKASIQLVHTALRDTVSELKMATSPEASTGEGE